MIQRIQSIYLSLAAIAGVVFIFLPFGNINKEGKMIALNALMNPIFCISIITISAFALISIFLFKNRKLQMRFVLLNILLSSLLLLVFIYGIYNHIQQDQLSPSFGVVLPLFMLLFNFLAYKGIQHDELLVKSMDRLR